MVTVQATGTHSSILFTGIVAARDVEKITVCYYAKHEMDSSAGALARKRRRGYAWSKVTFIASYKLSVSGECPG